MTTPSNLELEAKAFDEQIIERVENGHLPDLRRVESCHYFYNNPWREPEYVQIDFVEQFDLIRRTLLDLFPDRTKPVRILEIGCGPGHFSLELARAGFDMTGVDLSPQCIAVAERFAAEDPWLAERGPLQYRCVDFLSADSGLSGPYSACLFVGALHHFPDQEGVMCAVTNLLEPDGCILAHEPTRDRYTESTATVVHLIKTLLSAGGGYFEAESITVTPEQQHEAIAHLYDDLKYEDEHGDKQQSVNDNEAGYSDMVEAMDSHFQRELLQDRFAFFHEIIGGLRYSHEVNVKLAKYLHDMDARLCELGVIPATEFFYAGRRRS